MLAVDSRCRSVGRMVIVIAFFMLSCAASLRALDKSRTDCIPSFPFKESWWGADAAYSIPLPDGRSVWIFGDTLYGERRTVEGSDPRMVRNSIGVSTCDERGGWTVDYVIRRGYTGKTPGFFSERAKGTPALGLCRLFPKKDFLGDLLSVCQAPKTAS